MGWTWDDYIHTPAPVIDLLIEQFRREAKEHKSAMPRSARRRMR